MRNYFRKRNQANSNGKSMQIVMNYLNENAEGDKEEEETSKWKMKFMSDTKRLLSWS